MQTKMQHTVATATVLAMTIALSGSAFAQVAGGDIIGATQVSQSVLVVMKILGLIGVGWGFLRLMSGRHTIEGLTIMGVGALGLGKTQAIAQFLGLV